MYTQDISLVSNILVLKTWLTEETKQQKYGRGKGRKWEGERHKRERWGRKELFVHYDYILLSLANK